MTTTSDYHKLDRQWIDHIKTPMNNGKEIDEDKLFQLFSLASGLFNRDSYFQTAILQHQFRNKSRFKSFSEEDIVPSPRFMEFPRTKPSIDLLWLNGRPSDRQMMLSQTPGKVLFEPGTGVYQDTDDVDVVEELLIRVEDSTDVKLKTATWFLIPCCIKQNGGTFNRSNASDKYDYPESALMDRLSVWCARYIALVLRPKIVVCFGSAPYRRLLCPTYDHETKMPPSFKDLAISAQYVVHRRIIAEFSSPYIAEKTIHLKSISIAGMKCTQNNQIKFIAGPHPYVVSMRAGGSDNDSGCDDVDNEDERSYLEIASWKWERVIDVVVLRQPRTIPNVLQHMMQYQQQKTTTKRMTATTTTTKQSKKATPVLDPLSQMMATQKKKHAIESARFNPYNKNKKKD